MSKKIDLQWQQFDRLFVLEEAGRTKDRKALWLCQCDCGNKKIIRSSDLRRNLTRSCGCLRREIVSKRMSGRIVSEETRKKLSGKNNGMYGRTGKDNPIFGKTHSEETRKKMSENHADFSGKNHPNWNPNLTDEERQDKRKYPEYNNWRNQVFERDNYTCRCCEQRGGSLVAHHFKSYTPNKELRISIENGITVCKKCHLDFHHQYGYRNNTRKQFEEFLMSRGINVSFV